MEHNTFPPPLTCTAGKLLSLGAGRLTQSRCLSLKVFLRYSVLSLSQAVLANWQCGCVAQGDGHKYYLKWKTQNKSVAYSSVQQCGQPSACCIPDQGCNFVACVFKYCEVRRLLL